MTLPRERTRAVQNVRNYLRELLVTGKPKEPSLEFKQRVRYLLKHYPGEFELAKSHEKLPRIWGKPEEDAQNS